MGCGCGKSNNAIRRGSKNTTSRSSKVTKEAKSERRKQLKMIRINSTKGSPSNRKK